MFLRLDEILASKSNSLGSIALKAMLWCASQPYAAAVTLRNWAFDHGFKKTIGVEIPVVSVGNLTAGGTGKTPTVAFLAKWFRAHNKRVAILSRGYGAGSDGRNDEAKELEITLPDVPHLQSPDRIASARIAVDELGMELLLLDDGFQHRRIGRDLDIVLLDAREPFGFGYLLPRGLLREPLRSLKRADIVIATRCDQVDAQSLASLRSRVQRHNPRVAWVEAAHTPLRLRNSEGTTTELAWLQGKNVVAVCGIGNPQAFLKTIDALGAHLVGQVLFPDHHLFNAGDIREIGVVANEATNCEAILCTGKDLTKIGITNMDRLPLWSLDIELTIVRGNEILEDRLREVLRSSPSESLE